MNNLRRDIHSAFDVIEPSLGGMPERVVQTVLAERNGRLRKEKMVYRLRISLALVAAVLVVAVGAAAVITWNSLHNGNVSPAGSAPHLTALQRLEARPLTLPVVGPNAVCPNHMGTNTKGFDYGDGPVYANGGPAITTPWGHLYDVQIYVQPSLAGPILIRGKDLQSERRVAFVTTAENGTIEGTDATQRPSALRNEMVLDPTKPPVQVVVGSALTDFGEFAVRQGLAMGWKGCFGIQLDGPTFTEAIYGYDSSWSA